MSIEVNVTGNPIQASVTESGASVSVSPLSVAASVAAGIGPQGPTGPTGPTGPVASVNGFTGSVVLTSASVSAASAVHTHVSSDITDLKTKGYAKGLWDNANETVGVIAEDSELRIFHATIATAYIDVSEITADRTYKVPNASGTFSLEGHTHTTGQISGLDSQIAEQATNAAVVRTLNGITGTITIAAGDNVTVSTAGSTLTIAAGGGGGDAPMPTLTITGGSISPLILELIQQVT